MSTDFKENIKTMIREVLTQDLGIKNADVKDKVWSMVEHRMLQRINEEIEKQLGTDKIEKVILQMVEKVITAGIKNQNHYIFKTDLTKKMEDIVSRVAFDVSIKPKE